MPFVLESLGQPPNVAAGRRTMLMLIQLRWIAVIGQVATILIVHEAMGIPLPLGPLLAAPLALALINIGSLPLLKNRADVTDGELLVALLVDVGALTWQLYLTGGAANPFVLLYLLQIVIGAMLLRRESSWTIVAVTSLSFAGLMLKSQPLHLPSSHAADPLGLYIQGSAICFLLIAVLVVLFLSRIKNDLRERDAALAAIRQHAAEEEHIVRMGLLASGAAHELGTPLSSLSVILGDWQRMPQFAGDPELERDMADMRTAIDRCKTIVGATLASAGEARGVAPRITTMRQFLDEIVSDWRNSRLIGTLEYDDSFGEDVRIISDPALKQVIGNVIDNAVEVSPDWIRVSAWRENDALVLSVSDNGPGFTRETLMSFGQPYRSTKGRPGGGLGLFLLVNVLRTLGGAAEARSRPGGGAIVSLRLPLTAIAFEGEDQ